MHTHRSAGAGPGYGADVLPEVSVLLPCRDVETTIDQAIGSVLDERAITLQVIAIDDGSRDGTGARLAAWAARDPRVHVVRTEGVGIARALATALDAARAPEWIARMDGDDVSLPGRLARQIAALREDASLGVVGTRVEAFPGESVGEGLRRYVGWQNALSSPEEHARDLYVEAPLCHPSVMLRRAALEAVGGFREVPWPEDYDLWLRLHAAGWAMTKIPEVLLRWRQREGRLTFADLRYSLEAHRACKARFLAPVLRAHDRALTCWGAGPTGRRLARAIEVEGVRFARWIDIDPRKIGRIARAAPIASPDVLDPTRDFVVVAVGSSNARELVRADLVLRGFVEPRPAASSSRSRTTSTRCATEAPQHGCAPSRSAG